MEAEARDIGARHGLPTADYLKAQPGDDNDEDDGDGDGDGDCGSDRGNAVADEDSAVGVTDGDKSEERESQVGSIFYRPVAFWYI